MKCNNRQLMFLLFTSTCSGFIRCTTGNPPNQDLKIGANFLALSLDMANLSEIIFCVQVLFIKQTDIFQYINVSVLVMIMGLIVVKVVLIL